MNSGYGYGPGGAGFIPRDAETAPQLSPTTKFSKSGSGISPNVSQYPPLSPAYPGPGFSGQPNAPPNPFKPLQSLNDQQSYMSHQPPVMRNPDFSSRSNFSQNYNYPLNQTAPPVVSNGPLPASGSSLPVPIGPQSVGSPVVPPGAPLGAQLSATNLSGGPRPLMSLPINHSISQNPDGNSRATIDFSKSASQSYYEDFTHKPLSSGAYSDLRKAGDKTSNSMQGSRNETDSEIKSPKLEKDKEGEGEESKSKKKKRKRKRHKDKQENLRKGKSETQLDSPVHNLIVNSVPPLVPAAIPNPPVHSVPPASQLTSFPPVVVPPPVNYTQHPPPYPYYTQGPPPPVNFPPNFMHVPPPIVKYQSYPVPTLSNYSRPVSAYDTTSENIYDDDRNDVESEDGPIVIPNPYPPDHPEYHSQQMVIFDQYWNYVKENPYDFNSWTLLLSHVETLDNVDACRGVFNAFLPLYPYCYAYWKRYSDLEKKYGNSCRSLQILERGLEAIPLSIDLWLAYLNLFWELHQNDSDSTVLMRKQCERALATAGLEFRSDGLWEAYLEWESQNNRLLQMTFIYQRLIATPTKLYKKHWENYVHHIQQNDLKFILKNEEYQAMRQSILAELGSGEHNLEDDEDKVTGLAKEKLISTFLKVHKQTEDDVEKRWKYEEKIKRPYFHVKALDLRQLKNWKEYLDFEMEQGSHQRIVTLFERCLIACAAYEEFWCKYARYMEIHALGLKDAYKAGDTVKTEKPPFENQEIAKNSDLDVVNSVEDNKFKGAGDGGIQASILEYMSVPEDTGLKNASVEKDEAIVPPDFEAKMLPKAEIDGVGSGLTSVHKDPYDAVREVYRRACIVHCPKKPKIKLQWAAFEEEQNNNSEAKKLIAQVEEAYSDLLLPKLQKIDMERRQNNSEAVMEMYKNLFEESPTKIIRSWFAMKYARYLFKILGKPDKALSILRLALKKDRGNSRLYQQVLDVCYQRYPVDIKGFCAATELAIKSKDLRLSDKLFFAKRRMEFLEEFGTISQYRKAIDDLEKLDVQCPIDREKLTRKNIGVQVELVTDSFYVQNDLVKKEPLSVKKEDEKEEKHKTKEKTKDKEKKKKRSDKERRKKDEKGEEKSKKSKTSIGVADENNEDSLEEGEERDGDNYRKSRRNKRDRSSDFDDKLNKLPRYSYSPPNMEYGEGQGIALGTINNSPDNVHHDQLAPADIIIAPEPPASPCINVPDWFVQEGGELVISNTAYGKSILRYWPRFLTDKGNACMFKCLRQSVKWHQRRIILNNVWYPVSRLVSWFGPCDFNYKGLLLPKNDNWSPELIDLLHRLNQFTGHEFNSCFLNLYRHGHDFCPWHCDDHVGLGRHPCIASVSLGAVRVFELARKQGKANLIRFPLFPGSLLLMEGAIQDDWLHQVPKDPSIGKAERINLTFRIMFDMTRYVNPMNT